MNFALSRRQALLGATAALLSPGFARADEWRDAFQAKRKDAPWLIGYASAPATLDCAALTIEGAWPAALAGAYYRNGPARHEVGDLRYHHWFDGDGMIQQFRIADGKISHRGRMVQTDKYKREVAAGRALEPTFGTTMPQGRPPSSPASLNVANINVIAHGGRLLALWEAADAYAMNAQTLETVGPYVWRDDLKGVPFGAHPRVEADGTLWNFGYVPQADLLVLYRIGADGALKSAKLLKVPDIGMVHDFLVTQRHLVFVLPPIHYELAKLRQGLPYIDCFEWRGDKPIRVLVVDKNTLEIVRRHELPGGFVFHHGNAYEESDGTIRFDSVRHPDATVMTDTLRAVMRGESHKPPPSVTLVARLAADGTSRVETIADSIEFPRVDPRRIGLRHRYHWSVLFDSLDGGPGGGILRRDLESGAADIYRFGPNALVEEHVYVPRANGAEGEGWLIGTHLDVREGVTKLAVFDAMNLAAGPVAMASLPYALPLGLHGNFVGA